MRRSVLLAIVITALPILGAAGELVSLKIGEAVPAFTLENYDGREYSLGNIMKENKLTVLMFIATQCPISNAYNGRMVKLYDAYASKGVAFVGINSNKQEPVDEIAEHSKDNGFKFVVLKDVANKIADQYGAQVTPEIYVVDKGGVLLYHGRIDDNRNLSRVESRDLDLALDALLGGKQPPRAETKAFGCTIKRVETN
jgi:peroxiredoxin